MSPDLPKPLALQRGQLFHERYEVGSCLKAGGMGAVYEVLDTKTRRRRALKIMLPSIVSDADMRARFRLEAIVTANIESEHLVEAFDADVDAATGIPFLVMELLKGADLAQTLVAKGRLSAREAVVFLYQAALALERTHAAGIVHRDLKPENLFLTQRDDGSPRIKILDFGIAKVLDQGTQASTTRSLGSPLYMAPEQVRGDASIGPRADLYALGHMAYSLLVGEAYWQQEARGEGGVYAMIVRAMQGAEEPATARAHRREVVLPSAFDAWFARATAVDPAARFPNALACVTELAAALGEVLPTATPPASLAFEPPRASAAEPEVASATAPLPPASTAILGGRSAGGPGSGATSGITGAQSLVTSRPATPSARRASAPVGVLLLLLALVGGSFAWLRGRSDAAAPAVAPPTAETSPSPPPPVEVAPPPSASSADESAQQKVASAPSRVTPAGAPSSSPLVPTAAPSRPDLPSSPVRREAASSPAPKSAAPKAAGAPLPTAGSID
jgi:serine/threonine protein kinase